jgi:L-fuculose-phosphate aldolase
MTEALKRKLTNAGRVLTSQDQGDFVAGHVTVRLPDDPGRFLMKPATIGLDEMTLDNIITVDLEGQKVGGTMPRHNEVFIHSEVLRARPEIQCVIHTHAPHAVAFSSLGRELVPVNNEAGYFYKQLPIFSETSDLIVTQDRGKSVARCLGQHGAVILRNHGIVTAGRSTKRLWIALGRARRRVQLMAEWAGGPKFVAEGEDPGQKQARLQAGLTPMCSTIWCAPGAACMARPMIPLRRALRDRPERVQGIAIMPQTHQTGDSDGLEGFGQRSRHRRTKA